MVCTGMFMRFMSKMFMGMDEVCTVCVWSYSLGIGGIWMVYGEWCMTWCMVGIMSMGKGLYINECL